MNEYSIESNDVLLTRKGSIGNAFLVPNDFTPGIIDSDTIRVRILSKDLNIDFFLILMREAPFMNDQIFHTAKGAIIAGLNSQTIKKLLIPLPPRSEQDILLKAIQEINRTQNIIIYKIGSEIQALKTLKSSLIANTVIGGIKI
jgi:type I restriction enzyme S subunit